MISLTPQQISRVTGLPDQTLRHWRATLPPLQGLNGYTACFSPADALALLVIKHLVKAMGIAVASLRSAAGPLFEICRSTTWPLLADRALLIDVVRGTVELREPSSISEATEPILCVPMRHFAEELQSAWLERIPPGEQLELLPPTLLASPARRAG